MRFLHTSDWHLGATLGNHSRAEEHRLFLEHLVDVIVEHEIDVLLVAGDIYDRSQPSNEAQQLYYGFLARVAALHRHVQVVIIAGNHDSPTFIDAPRPVLEALRVSVIGELGRGEERERCIVRLTDRSCPESAEHGAVVVAVPFVHEYMLGVSPGQLTPEELPRRFAEAFGDVYRRLSQVAAERYPGVPQLAMGHLTCGAVEAGDYRTAIHQVGTIGGLPSTVFPETFQYVALGHIHRPYPVVRERNIWYSGTPIAVSFDEARVTRRVMVFDLLDSRVENVRAVDLPSFRTLATISCEHGVLRQRLAELTVSSGLPALVDVRLHVERYAPTIDAELSLFLESLGEGRPQIVSLRQHLASDGGAESHGAVTRDLADLTPEEVFVALHQRVRASAPSERVLIAFRELTSSIGGER